MFGTYQGVIIIYYILQGLLILLNFTYSLKYLNTCFHNLLVSGIKVGRENKTILFF